MVMMSEGLKYDSGKERWDLAQPLSLKEYVKVLTHGAEKYAPYNWRKVEPRKSRYIAALFRHVVAYILGETMDPSTGYHHLAHAMCCLTFVMEPELEELYPHNTNVLESEYVKCNDDSGGISVPSCTCQSGRSCKQDKVRGSRAVSSNTRNKKRLK